MIATTPPPLGWDAESDSVDDWLGRATAVMQLWNPAQALSLVVSVPKANSFREYERIEGFREIRILLRAARHNLRLRTSGPLNRPIGEGRVFEYFDEFRKLIAGAASEVFFVDPYLDAEFVSTYLTQVRGGVLIRLLTSPKTSRLNSVLPAIKLYQAEHGNSVEVRSSPALHDRYLFIDSAEVYHSGASFKDGGKKSGTVISQIVDAFPVMWQNYSDLWTSAKIEL
ncbi:MAG: hypothetical protein NTV52_00700 [Acidobacteria bacterium]|nr:hypothetical protein [Acidobacteriota bacterium]